MEWHVEWLREDTALGLRGGGETRAGDRDGDGN